MRRAWRVAVQRRFSSACSSSVAGPSRSISDQKQLRSTVVMSSKDQKLIQRGEFYRVRRNGNTYSSTSELVLPRMQDHITHTYRVSPNTVMVELVLKLENGDASLISLLQRSPEQWIPMSIMCCGRALSTVEVDSRRVIGRRLWNQIEQRGFAISIGTINAHLRVNLDNNETWDPFETLTEIEEKRGLVPDQETFHILLEKLSLTGETEKCNTMLYEMVRRGYSPSDPISHSHLVYANAMKGYNQTVDSMIQQALTKFGSEGEALSLGAACVAAAAGGRIDRLRDLLRRSLDYFTNESSGVSFWALRFSTQKIFYIIWALSEKRSDNETMEVIQEIMNKTKRFDGFFRFLAREIDRHISSSHFHTTICLLKHAKRAKNESLRQVRIAFVERSVGKMCRSLVRSRMENELLMDMINRMEFTLNIRSRLIHDEILLAGLTLKDCDLDDRFSFFSSILPIVDPEKERPHLILPLLATTPKIDDRLKLIFRFSSLGYSNFEILDTSLISEYLFQPMYNRQVWLAREKRGINSPIENMTAIIRSFGIPKASVWRMMQGWWKLRKEEEKGTPFEMRSTPYSQEIQEWLRSSFSTIFTDRIKPTVPALPLTQKELETAIEKRDGSMIFSLLSSRGWPQDVDLPSFAPKILELLLANESSGNIMKWLSALSREASFRREGKEEMMMSPLENHHLLKVMRHRMNNTELPAKELIKMIYELKRLFPQAVMNDSSNIDMIDEVNRFFVAFFFAKDGTRRQFEYSTEDTFDLLKTLITLKIVKLSKYSESISPYCLIQILDRFGWDSAVKMWERFQSSFSYGNGLAILLSHSLKLQMEISKEEIQRVLHKARALLSPSRIHSLYAAALSHSERDRELAMEYFKNHGSEISSSDCSYAYQLISQLRFPEMDRDFIRTFPTLCLNHTKLGEDEEAARTMLHISLLHSQLAEHGDLIVEMCDLFAQYGVEPDEKEKKIVERTMEAHQSLVQGCIFSPDGFIQDRVHQEFVKKDE